MHVEEDGEHGGTGPIAQVTMEDEDKASPLSDPRKDIDTSEQANLIYVGWNGPDDPENPRNWSSRQKRLLSIVGYLFCALGSLSVSVYSVIVDSIQQELRTSRIFAISGLSIFTFTFGVAPLILAPLSEVWGRRGLYIFCAIVFTVFQIPQAAATNIETFLVTRFLSAIGGSTAISLVGGTLSDLYPNEERGMPMAMFSFAAFAATGLGPMIFGYVSQYYGFRLVLWINFGLSAIFTILLIVVSKETREGVLLSRKAAKMRQETGDQRFVTQLDEERASLLTIIKVSLTRPAYLFFTEPTIQAFTTSISFAWAVQYLLLISVPVVFRNTYHFTIGQTGLTYTSLLIGTFAATGLGYYTNQLYLRDVEKMGPEARMWTGMVGGVLFPLGCWIWAWTTFESIHWIVPTIGLGILFAGMFLLYLTVFNYLADSYTLYSASAISAMNFWRNIAAASFPLFTDQIYDKLGIHGAGSLVAGLATLLAVIPFVAFRYGNRLRRKSRFAQEMSKLQLSVN